MRCSLFVLTFSPADFLPGSAQSWAVQEPGRANHDGASATLQEIVVTNGF